MTLPYYLISFTFLICLVPTWTHGQERECACVKDAGYVVERMENDHPGFARNLRKRKGEYQELRAYVLRSAADIGDPQTCVKLLQEYLAFFRDGHLRISIPDPDRVPKSERDLTKDLFLEQINDDTHYLRLPTFYKSYWQELDSFYDEIEPQVASMNHLIIDVRNNTGGGPRMYQQILKALKRKRTAPERISLLFNSSCASACEHFVVDLGRKSHVTTYGENSYGALGYGDIMQITTPNCQFRFDLPSRRFRTYLKYEIDGVQPDVRLEKGSGSWLQQIIEGQ
jgi:hypothetical protein